MITSRDLNYALEAGIINGSQVEQLIDMARRKEILKSHPYKIWQAENGRWLTYVLDAQKKRVQISRKTREDLEDYLVKIYNDKVENPTLDEIFTEYNQSKLDRGKVSFPTWRRNDRYFQKHYRDTGFGKRHIRNVSRSEFAEFMENQVVGQQMTSKAYAGFKGVTKMLLSRAKANDYISWTATDLFETLDISKNDFKRTVKDVSKEVYSIEEMDKIVEYLKGSDNIKDAAILLMFLTGLRVGEVAALRHEDLDEDGYFLQVRRTETRIVNEDKKEEVLVKDYPKTQESVRTVVIPKQWRWFVARLWTVSRVTDWVFTFRTGNRIYAKSLRNRLETVCDTLKIKYKSPHKIRKTYATILQDNVTDELTKQQMGHTSITTTREHYYFNRNSVDKVAETLSAIDEFNHSH